MAQNPQKINAIKVRVNGEYVTVWDREHGVIVPALYDHVIKCLKTSYGDPVRESVDAFLRELESCDQEE